MEKKLISFGIPSYNSEAYMEKCINTLLTGGEEVEILIIDDGSKDRTAEIADRYAAEYPTVVKAIHQENAGHGGAVIKGLHHATGIYYKVVDSDDWVDESALQCVLQTIRKMQDKGQITDIILVNYVLENALLNKQNVIKPKMFQPNQICGWDAMRKPQLGEYLMMHSILYRTELLTEHGIDLPHHTFHVDNLYAYEPLKYVQSMIYLDVDFYRYFIGRSDQSSAEAMLVKRIDQHIRVNKLMIDAVDLKQIAEPLREYLFLDLEIMTAITSAFLLIPGDQEHIAKRDELWAYLEQKAPEVYQRMRKRLLGRLVNAKTHAGQRFTVGVMRTIRRIRGN